MKKILAITVMFYGVVSSLHAQGLVFFSNNSTSRIFTNSAVGLPATGLTSGSDYGNPLYYYTLFYSTTQSTIDGNTYGMIGSEVAISGGRTAGTNTPGSTPATYVWQASGWNWGGIYATNTQMSGRFIAVSVDSRGQATVQGLGLGGSAQFVIVGWSANIGSTLAALEAWYANPINNGWIGQSQVTGLITVGNGDMIPTPGLVSSSYLASMPDSPTFSLGEVVAESPAAVMSIPEPSTMVLAGLGTLSLLALRRKK